MASAIAIGLLAGTTAIIGLGMLVAPGAAVGVRVTGLLLVIVMAATCWRAARIGVLISADGIRIRTWVRTIPLPWEEILGFRVGPGSSVQPTFTLHVHTTDGRDLRIQAFSASAVINRRTRVHDAVERLNARLATFALVSVKGESAQAGPSEPA